MTAARTTVRLPEVTVLVPEIVVSSELRADWQRAKDHADGDPCERCDLEKPHAVRWRANPHQPYPAPADVLDELAEACFCCFWGPGGMFERLVRESCDDRDIKVEHLTDTGRWVDFDLREVA